MHNIVLTIVYTATLTETQNPRDTKNALRHRAMCDVRVKRIPPLPFFHWCRKSRLRDELTPEIHCDHTAYSLIARSFWIVATGRKWSLSTPKGNGRDVMYVCDFGEMWVSQRYLWNVWALTPEVDIHCRKKTVLLLLLIVWPNEGNNTDVEIDPRF
jgi:hypothetical protein